MTYFIVNQRELLAFPIVGIVYNVVLYMFILSTFFLASFIDPGIYPRGTCTYTHTLTHTYGTLIIIAPGLIIVLESETTNTFSSL